MEDASAHIERPRQEIPALGWIGLVVASLPYLLSLVILLTFERRNPEDGMILGFAMLAEIPLWIGLAVFLFSNMKRARLSLPIISGVCLIFPLSAAACFMSFDILERARLWLMLVPLLLPAIAGMFGMWAIRMPTDQRRIHTAAGFGAAALALLAIFALECRDDRARYAQGQAEAEAELARYEAEFQTHLQNATRLDGLLTNLTEEPDRQVRAMATIRRLTTRQVDAVRLLQSERPLLDLARLHDFNLEATPELCRAYRARFDSLLEILNRGDATPGDIEQQIPNVAWLGNNACDLNGSARPAVALLRKQDAYAQSVADGLEAAADLDAIPLENR